jgi:hypothetical protein
MTPLMIEKQSDHLYEKPSHYLEEIVIFLWDRMNFRLKLPSPALRAFVIKG